VFRSSTGACPGRSPRCGCARTHGRTEHADGIGGAEGALEQTEGVELRQPRAVGDVGCTAGHVCGVPGIDQCAERLVQQGFAGDAQ